MIGATSLAKVTPAASYLFTTSAAAATSVTSRMTDKRFMAFLLKASSTKPHETSRRIFLSSRSFVWLRGGFCLLDTRTGSLRLRLSQILFVERVIEVHDHHLFPCLRSPAHFFRRVGVELVVDRIVVMRDTNQLAALRRDDLFLEDISHLPAEVPSRHRQQNL